MKKISLFVFVILIFSFYLKAAENNKDQELKLRETNASKLFTELRSTINVGTVYYPKLSNFSYDTSVDVTIVTKDNLEFGMGMAIFGTKVGNEKDFSLFIPDKDNYIQRTVTPAYFVFKYNLKLNDNSRLTPYLNIGEGNFLAYELNKTNYDPESSSLITNSAGLNGGLYLATGVTYSYKHFLLSLEYKNFRIEEYRIQEHFISVSSENIVVMDNATQSTEYRYNSYIGFKLGYSFDAYF